MAHLKKEISKLDEYENLLDKHRLFVEQSILNVTEDIDTRRYLYVTHEDLVQCYGTDNTIVVVNAPFNTNVAVQVSFLSTLQLFFTEIFCVYLYFMLYIIYFTNY